MIAQEEASKRNRFA